jgi:hypothetical protein
MMKETSKQSVEAAESSYFIQQTFAKKTGKGFNQCLLALNLPPRLQTLALLDLDPPLPPRRTGSVQVYLPVVGGEL